MKNKISNALLLVAGFVLACCPAALAQAGTATILVNDNLVAVAGVLLAGLELVMRLKPTEKDYSLINFAIRVLNTVVPNKAVSRTSGLKGIFKPVIFKSLKK